MKKVYSHENLMLVTSAKNLLELNGIERFIKNEFHASGGHVGFESIPIELWVHDASQAEKAVSVLEKELSAEHSGQQWACTACGEVNEASFETCWKCQAAAPSLESVS